MAKKPQTEGSEDEAGEGEAGGSKKKKLIIIGGAAAAVLLIGGGAAFFLLGGSKEPAAEAVMAVQEEQPHAYYFDLPVMILNLSTADERPTFVKLEVALEVSDQKMLDVIKPNLPRVLDAFQTYMRELRASDLQGSAGLYRLKEELQRRVNIAVYPARVDDVLFKNVIVQ
ncbi:flagellar basal body-associated FliL family protein [Oryzibacter oryziterrae]|uniref:flagellar basal body-associated FliL family protein n=1 Tax=Oryzibacter oryziterrae TaxID=2766474 RepID=UPI001F0151E8|nr:flagellar basal body-associated FliL family protein [Oryzibacter oryziterrae]